MEEKTIKQLSFIGVPYMPTMMDENGSFFSAYNELEQNKDFQALDEINQLDPNRASLIVFGGDSFMFWQGMLFEDFEQQNLPNGLMKYDLPASKIVEERKPGSVSQFSLPLGSFVNSFLSDIKKAGIKIPANLGLSEHPYLINALNLNTQDQVKRVYLGKVILDVND